MTATITSLVCSQCGCEAPIDAAALVNWLYGPLALSHECDDCIEHLLICPACIEEEHLLLFEEGLAG